jgi:hypothetical protein
MSDNPTLTKIQNTSIHIDISIFLTILSTNSKIGYADIQIHPYAPVARSHPDGQCRAVLRSPAPIPRQNRGLASAAKPRRGPRSRVLYLLACFPSCCAAEVRLATGQTRRDPLLLSFDPPPPLVALLPLHCRRSSPRLPPSSPDSASPSLVDCGSYDPPSLPYSAGLIRPPARGNGPDQDSTAVPA